MLPTPLRAGFFFFFLFPWWHSVGTPPSEWHSITRQEERSQERDGHLIQHSDSGCQVGFWKMSCSPLLKHILDAYLSYCKMYVTKQSGISLTIIPFMPRLGISWLGVGGAASLRGPGTKAARGRSPAQQAGLGAGQEQRPAFLQVGLLWPSSGPSRTFALLLWATK